MTVKKLLGLLSKIGKLISTDLQNGARYNIFFQVYKTTSFLSATKVNVWISYNKISYVILTILKSLKSFVHKYSCVSLCWNNKRYTQTFVVTTFTNENYNQGQNRENHSLISIRNVLFKSMLFDVWGEMVASERNDEITKLIFAQLKIGFSCLGVEWPTFLLRVPCTCVPSHVMGAGLSLKTPNAVLSVGYKTGICIRLRKTSFVKWLPKPPQIAIQRFRFLVANAVVRPARLLEDFTELYKCSKTAI